MRHLYSLLAVPVLATGLALPQTQERPATPQDRPAPTTTAKPAGVATETSTDNILASWLLIGNEGEIALARLAVQRAQDPEVKNFAQSMIDDHGKLAQELQGFAAGSASPRIPADSPPRVPADKPVDKPRSEMQTPTQTPERPTATMSRAPAGELDHVGLLRELGDQCLATARKELEQKQGADFDRCYMHMAVGGHMKANDAMTVFQRHASSGLKQAIASGQKVVAAHLQEAKTIAQKLDGKVQ